MVLVDTHLAADIRVVDIRVADIRQAVDIHPVAVRILVVGCYKDPLAEVVMGEHIHRTDLADLDLDPG